MKYEITENGNLKIIADLAENPDNAGGWSDDLNILRDIKDRCEGDDVQSLVDLLEDTGWRGNGELYQVKPELIGALTDAPMLSDSWYYDETSDIDVFDRVFWYPNYMISNWLDVLIHNGFVVFQSAK